SFIPALLASAALVAANNAPPPADAHNKAYATVYGAQYAQAVPPAIVQPATIVQNAATAEPTVTVTVTNGAASKVLSLGSALIAGAALLSYF
ncbi:hypothetical protein GGI12_005387, partial [Dipsacomyces acuminosporus]